MNTRVVFGAVLIRSGQPTVRATANGTGAAGTLHVNSAINVAAILDSTEVLFVAFTSTLNS